jgi:hypothetical protein
VNKYFLQNNLETSELDQSVIPFGDYCYEIIELKPDEVLSTDVEQFGKNLREFRYHGNSKEVLCPYWFRLDNGMTRCEYLNIEDDENSYLADEIKICDVAIEDVQTYTHSKNSK